MEHFLFFEKKKGFFVNRSCPCHSGKLYQACCKPYHEGRLPENALILMRSRYSAYALGLIDFIIKTTHPKNPSLSIPLDEWKAQIRDFSTSTSFDGLVIHEFVDGANTAFVTFSVILRQQANDISFTEKSEFEKEEDQWLYKEGTITSYTRRTA